MVAFRLSARSEGLLVLATLVGLFATSGVASGAQPCPPLAPELASRVGSAFGTPTGCSQTDAEGNSLQTTTTGLVVVRPDGMAVFASGDQHWALTEQGLESWSGNWHNGLYPPVSPAADVQAETSAAAGVQAETLRAPVATVQPLTLVGVDPDQSTALVREDHSGSALLVQTASGCPDLPTAVGDHVFLRSVGTASDLVLVRQRETCAVATMRAAEDD